MQSKTMQRFAVALYTVFGFGLIAEAQTQELDWAQQMFEKLDHDFGVVASGAKTSYRLKITNKYKETVHISSVTTTCGCSAASPEQDTLKTFESTHVVITMNTTRFQRQKDSNVIVQFSAPFFAQVRIPIHAYIRTDVVMSPGSANFGAANLDKEMQKTIKIDYAGRANWKVKEVRSKSEYIKAEIVEKQRGNGQVTYELAVTLKPGAPVGKLREQITLVTNDQANPYVPLLVEANIEAEFTITPSLVSLGEMTPGKEKKFNVVVRGKKPFSISKIDGEKGIQGLEVKLPKTTLPVHVLAITLKSPEKPGKFNQEFSLIIADRPEPVKFKVYGNIVDVIATETK